MYVLKGKVLEWTQWMRNSSIMENQIIKHCEKEGFWRRHKLCFQRL